MSCAGAQFHGGCLFGMESFCRLLTFKKNKGVSFSFCPRPWSLNQSPELRVQICLKCLRTDLSCQNWRCSPASRRERGNGSMRRDASGGLIWLCRLWLSQRWGWKLTVNHTVQLYDSHIDFFFHFFYESLLREKNSSRLPWRVSSIAPCTKCSRYSAFAWNFRMLWNNLSQVNFSLDI